MTETPFSLGYKMPAEWEEHDATWLSWPKDPESFPEEILPRVEDSYIRMIDALHRNERVCLLVDDEKSERRVAQLLKSNGIDSTNIAMHRIPTSDVWFRDYGPIFVTKKGGVAFTRWRFNAWGGKYEELKRDAQIPDKIPLGGIRGFNVQMVLEGGSIDMNGLGTCLTTEQCLLNSNRNPSMGKSQIEKNLADYLGATNIIWLKSGIEGDDTDGHVDDLARFVNRDTVVCAVESNHRDDNYNALKDNYAILEQAKDQDGKKLKVVQIPMPGKVLYNGQRLPASYANFYIANKTVLVPIFDDPNDQKALGILGKLFPERKVVGINCRDLVYGFGSIHCVTQQQPKTPRVDSDLGVG
ncbi:MAG: agmatine deiminase family protein [Candidatus Micrarchaeota archaeon]|nr:agmatine deiminase family protein [Candidatus Micrarchaeota archaeon]